MEPLATVLTGSYLEWLPKATYPVRIGMHANSAFGLSMALAVRPDAGRARAARPGRGHRGGRGPLCDLPDTDYPGGWEPSGHDFLSPALAEAELMARLLAPEEFERRGSRRSCPAWRRGEGPAALFSPAEVFRFQATGRSPTCTA